MVMNDIPDVQRIPMAGAQQDDPGGSGQTDIVVLCTANVCRSPMAAALLTRRLAALGVAVPVHSAGMLRQGDPPHPEVVSVMAGYGIAIASHRSRIARAADLAGLGLVLAMARENLRYAVLTEPGAWLHAFTLKELVRRGEQIGPGCPVSRSLAGCRALTRDATASRCSATRPTTTWPTRQAGRCAPMKTPPGCWTGW